MIADPSNVSRVQIKLMVLLNTQISDLNMFVNVETGVFQRFLCTSYGTAVDGNKHLAALVDSIIPLT